MTYQEHQISCPECHRPMPGKLIKWGGVTLDREKLEVTFKNNVIRLTPRETDLLAAIMGAEGRLAGYGMLEDLVFGDNVPLGMNTVRNLHVQACNLKRKTGLPIHTIEGAGMVMVS